RVGVNPFQFGLAGATDFHNALSAPEETLVPGHPDTNADVRQLLQDEASYGGVRTSAAGVTGVWAESNTRESIFDAFYRRETFATSGTRVRVRFFAGSDYPPGITKQRDWVKAAYAQGVPMGSDLAAKDGRAPRFLVQAFKDPDSGNLDRIQIVKVWLQDGR